MRRFSVIGILLVALFMFGCEYWVDVPAGYIGRVLTPNGWEKKMYEAGSVDIKTSGNRPDNRIVLLEVTSNTVKESFAAASQAQEDHRILIGKVPVAVDVYIRAIVPEEDQIRNDIYAQVSPASAGQERVFAINVAIIYGKFAAMDVRSAIRATLSKYKSFEEINSNLEKANIELASVVIEEFKKTGVPLIVQNVKISNVKPDETLWQAENDNQAAIAKVEQIKKLGDELAKSPKYIEFKKWETLSEAVKSGKVGNFSITVIEGQPGGMVIGK